MCQKNGIYPESNEELKHKLYFWYVILFIQSVPLQVFNTSCPNWSNQLSSLWKRGSYSLKFKGFRLLNPNYIAQTSVESKIWLLSCIPISSLLLHAQYFSHSQIQVIPSSMPFTPGCIVRALPSTSNSTVSTHSLSNRLHSFIKWTSNVPFLQTCYYYHYQ